VSLARAPLAVGDPIPRIQCVAGYTPTLYAQGLSAPDGLAFGPDGLLYVAQESAGRVSQVGPTGAITTVLDGLRKPEGIAVDGDGTLYVVEDVEDGRVIGRTSGGLTTTLATGLDAPEGIVWATDGTLYVTESNIQFTTKPSDLQTRVTALGPSGTMTHVITHTPSLTGDPVRYWSYAGIALGPDGQLYVTNELSGRAITRSVDLGPTSITVTLYTTDSVFAVDPTAGTRTLFVAGLERPEGLRFSPGGGLPLYVAEEDTGGGSGRLSRVEPDGTHSPLCTGFYTVEDVALDAWGTLYVSEGGSGGSIVRIEVARQNTYMPVVLRSH
jgi:sugar lactone lactonase YvrE